MPLALPALAAAAFVGGLLVAAQGPIYARLGQSLGNNTLAATFFAFLTGAGAIGLVLLAVGGPFPKSSELARVPAWVWLGGLFGAYHVAVSMLAVPRLGAALFVMIALLGSLAGSALYDHFALFGLERRPLSAASVIGTLVVLAGVAIKIRG